MKILFEEYGKTIIVVIAIVAMFALLFIRLDFFGILGSVADVNTEISHSQGEDSLNTVINREKPLADFSAVDLHMYNNLVFQPLKGVVFTDAEKEIISDENIVVTSILYCDSSGKTTELIENYNDADDIIILNHSHYSNSHAKCTLSEVTTNNDGRLVIAEENTRNNPGVVTVTYMATDKEAQVTVEQLTFVIDGKSVS